MKVYKTVFIPKSYLQNDVMRKLKDIGHICDTDYGTTELSSHDVRLIEDDVQTILNVAEDEDIDTLTMATQDDKFALQEAIGSDTYDMLLNEDIDLVLFIDEA